MTNLNIIKSLKNSKSVCIIGHVDPDADALASMTVLKDFLINEYKIPTVDLLAETNKIQENCQFILKNHLINSCKYYDITNTEYDVSIAVDSTNLDRLGIYAEVFKNSKQKIVIDHHDTNTNFGDNNIVLKAASTSEIVYSLLESLNYNFTTENCENIYAGIITDTNNFTTPNLTEDTFNVVGKIISKINYLNIYDNFFANFSLNNAKLLSFALKNIITIKNNKILITYLNKKHYKKSNSNQNDITGIINKISTISGNIFSCLIFSKDKNFYVSLRAKNGYNVANIAKKFGGGGHIGAAGFLTNLSLRKIIKIIKKEFLNIL